MSKHERLRWQKSAEREWDVSLVVVEEQEEAHQGCEVKPVIQQSNTGNTNQGQKMTLKSLNVRLTRSNPGIPWGFELQSKGADLIVSKVEQGSMADKAGIERGDTVQDILNQKASSLNAALGRIQNALEITMTLIRPIKDSPSLPWAFQTNTNGQLAVEHYNQNGQVIKRSDPQTKGFINSFVSELNAPVFDGNVQQQNSQLPYNTTTHKVESNSNWNQDDGNVTRRYESKRSYTRTESSSVPPDNNRPAVNLPQQSNQFHQQQNIGTKTSQSQQNFSSNQQSLISGPGQKAPGQQQNFNQFNQHQVTQQRLDQSSKQQNGYPQFPQNQYNDQLESARQQYESQKTTTQTTNTIQQRSIAVPGGIDYTSIPQSGGANYNQHLNGKPSYKYNQQTQLQKTQSQPQKQQTDFAGSYGSQINQQVKKQQVNPQSTQNQKTQNQQNTTNNNVYQLSQYDQTDTISFPAHPQQVNNQSNSHQQINSNNYSQQRYQQEGPNNQQPYYNQETKQVPSQQAYYQQNINGNQYIEKNQQEYVGSQNNFSAANQQNANENQYTQQNSNNSQRGRQNIRFNQSGQYSEAPDWESQRLDRHSHQSRQQPPRRSRSQPRCCSRNEVLPGPLIYYQPPHSRTYRELSPHARVHHLQYNSPLNLYSDEAAAEAYRQHTGQKLHFLNTSISSIPTDSQKQSAAYLQSETHRLINENELGMRPDPSGPIQSASLRRIANAVGVQLD